MGSHVAVVGASGSGKSTLLHLLAGLDQPTTGEVSWPALGDRPRLRPGPIAMVFQSPSLLPALDVIENVALPLVLAGITDRDARAQAATTLEHLGLGGLGAKLPEEISGGQSQRIAVARALVASPVLILADEPTGQLDAASAAEVIDALLDTARSTGAALIVATHDPIVAGQLEHRWSMIDGQLEVGATDEVAQCSR
jgi:ABC-type lipoprotein export system ATPase subunit